MQSKLARIRSEQSEKNVCDGTKVIFQSHFEHSEHIFHCCTAARHKNEKIIIEQTMNHGKMMLELYLIFLDAVERKRKKRKE